MSNGGKTTQSGLSFEEALNLQVLEGNPLDAEQVAMFAMFEREGYSDEQRRKYLVDRALNRARAPAAE
jgi:hypothetical protein